MNLKGIHMILKGVRLYALKRDPYEFKRDYMMLKGIHMILKGIHLSQPSQPAKRKHYSGGPNVLYYTAFVQLLDYPL